MYKLTTDTIAVGIDVHKYSHTAVAQDCLGTELGSLEFSNQSLERFVLWSRKLAPKKQLIIGVEDMNGYGLHLGNYLFSNNFQVLYVPSVLTDRVRKHSTHKEKTDYLDAKRVGKVIFQKMEETLPAADIIAEGRFDVRTLDLLVQEREDLVTNQTRLKNQLHVLLHQYYGDGYKQGFESPFCKKGIAWYQKNLADKDQPQTGLQACLVDSIKRRFTRLVMTQEQISDITNSMKKVAKRCPDVQRLISQLPGCGLINACKIKAEIGFGSRFINPDKLARYGGAAPVNKSSGRSRRLYIDKSGNRKLNQAIHSIALTQIGHYGPAKAYYAKKQAEGKTKLWALRCLKRHINNRVFAILNEME